MSASSLFRRDSWAFRVTVAAGVIFRDMRAPGEEAASGALEDTALKWQANFIRNFHIAGFGTKNKHLIFLNESIRSLELRRNIRTSELPQEVTILFQYLCLLTLTLAGTAWQWTDNTAKTRDTAVTGCGTASGPKFRNRTRTCGTCGCDTAELPVPVLHPRYTGFYHRTERSSGRLMRNYTNWLKRTAMCRISFTQPWKAYYCLGTL